MPRARRPRREHTARPPAGTRPTSPQEITPTQLRWSMARSCTAVSVSRSAASAPPPVACARVESMELRVLLSLMPAGPEYLVSQNPLHEQPVVAADANGDFVIVWQDERHSKRASPNVG